MDPATISLAFSGAVSLAKALAPIVRDMIHKGDIPVEQQAETLKSIEDLRAMDFTGPEWNVS